MKKTNKYDFLKIQKRKPRPNHFETIKRTRSILRMMNQIPQTSKQIYNKLIDLGYDISERTVLRDMQSLPEEFPDKIFVLDEQKPYRYKLPKGIPKDSAMSPQEAVCLQLAKEYLNPILPPGALDPIAPYLKEAELILEQQQTDARIKNWRKKVLTLNEGFNLQPAQMKEGILENVHEALWQGKVINVQYKSKNKAQASEYSLHPCGLVYRGRISYLICSFENDTKNFIYLPLQRFEAIEITSEDSEHKDTDVKTVARSLVGFNKNKKKISITLKFTHFAGGHLLETPISLNQKISKTKDNYYLVSDKVDDDMELRFWIRAFGDEVEVIKPKSLRNEFRAMATRMGKRYEAN